VRFTTRRRIAAGLAVLAWIAIALWLLRPKPGRVVAEDPIGERAPAGAAPPPAVPGLGVGGPKGTPPATGAAMDAEAPAPAAGTARIHGKVTWPSDVAAPPRVAVWAARLPDGETLARREIADGESAEYALDVPAPPGTTEVWIRAEVEGLARLERVTTISPGSDVVEDLVFGGFRVRGRVVDEQGRALPDFALVLVRRRMWGSEGKRWEADGTITADPDHREFLARARTNAKGMFEVRGFGGKDVVHVGSLDPDWEFGYGSRPILKARIDPNPTPQDVVAVPAYGLDVSLLDRRTGKPAEGHTDGSLTARRAGKRLDGIFFSGGSPRMHWWKPLPAGGTPFELEVRAEVEGFHEASAVVAIDGADRRKSLTLTLDPLRDEDFGVLLFDLGELRDATPPPEVMRWRTHEGGTTGTALRAERLPDGLLRLRLPYGRPDLSVTPQGAAPFDKLYAWRGMVDVLAGRETRFVVPWPASGSLRIRIGVEHPASPGRIWLRLEAPGRGLADFNGTAPSGELLAPRVPVGEWTLQTLAPLEVPEQKVVIREGVETLVEVRR
jgi:hypothetical protein